MAIKIGADPGRSAAQGQIRVQGSRAPNNPARRADELPRRQRQARIRSGLTLVNGAGAPLCWRLGSAVGVAGSDPEEVLHRFQTVPGWLMTCLAALGAFAMVSMGGTAQAALLGLVVFLALPPVAKMVAPSGWVRGFAIVAGGPKEAPPVILTSASAMAGWLWHHNMAKLSADHRLYAIGNIGGVGKNALSDVGRVPSSRIVIVKGDHLIGAQIPDQVNPVIGDSLS